MTTKQYQSTLLRALSKKLPNHEFKNEWVSFRKYNNQYSPKVDIALGPFSIIRGEDKIEEYGRLVHQGKVEKLLQKIYKFHCENVADDAMNNELEIYPLEYLVNKNKNARCLIAFEIENNNSRKHILGSMINAASLGRIGIGIAFSDKSFRTFIRMLNYLAFLKKVEKNSYDTTNFLVVKREQLDHILQ